ncbi:hypothetical protein ESA94_03930 [Lacibacter luteus]|uniref:Uncharacterized protein n=1 Tax=Lacibacter luteus TaxID=2508719 RepID=A0A4V1M805_9BACT|nr:hypothetical protein [Lacibacter luteus]RXK62172.1 hypothetical protein ESA94_03930 [Lacibacter luteus]
MQGKINKDYLVLLKLDLDSKYLKVDFLNIEKLLEHELHKFLNALETSTQKKTLLREFKEFRFLLNYFDYCEVIANSYQEIPNYSGYKGLRYLLSEPKDELINIVKIRLSAYRIENAYTFAKSLIEKEKTLAFSHRKAGWSAEPFQLSDKFQIQFKTNFGYGYVSYFYLVITYKNIKIIPYSDWIIYNDASTYEIQRYTRKYKLADESWNDAMEDCKSLYNSSISNENKFVETYIIQEAKKMVEGLKKIMEYNEFKLLNLDKDLIIIRNDGYKIIEYRAEKVSGALTFINHLKNFSAIQAISEIINEIKIINKELLPVLKREIELITERLNKIEPELQILEPFVRSLSDRSNNIRHRRNQIVDDLHKKYKINFDKKDRKEEIERLLTKDFPYWKADENEYFEIHNKNYNPLKMEVTKLKTTQEKIAKHSEEIENYLKKT